MSTGGFAQPEWLPCTETQLLFWCQREVWISVMCHPVHHTCTISSHITGFRVSGDRVLALHLHHRLQLLPPHALHRPRLLWEARGGAGVDQGGNSIDLKVSQKWPKIDFYELLVCELKKFPKKCVQNFAISWKCSLNCFPASSSGGSSSASSRSSSPSSRSTTWSAVTTPSAARAMVEIWYDGVSWINFIKFNLNDHC